MRKFTWLGALLLVGCANMSPMALNKQTESVDVSKKSVVLMSIDLGRQEASRYVPRPTVISFTSKMKDGKEDRQVFTIDQDAGTYDSELRNKFLLRVALEPGQYDVNAVGGSASAFPFAGFFSLPLLLKLDVPPQAVIYAGRINALMRPRVGDEFRAGSVLPLIDQAATGISNNTFDVSIMDASQEDLADFRSQFPALRKADITKTILPPFDRNKVQYWWDHDGKTEKNAAALTDKPVVAQAKQ